MNRNICVCVCCMRKLITRLLQGLVYLGDIWVCQQDKKMACNISDICLVNDHVVSDYVVRNLYKASVTPIYSGTALYQV